METFQRRGLVGSGELNPLETFAATFEELAANGRFSEEALALFRELSRRIARETRRPKSCNDDLGRVLDRIRGLRAKTTEQGCTEQEALAAAEKVGELLERYGLSLSEVDLRQQPCEGFGIDTGRRQHGAFDRCVPAIADFSDCRVWSETSLTGTLRFVFFGLSADVEAAHYLYRSCHPPVGQGNISRLRPCRFQATAPVASSAKARSLASSSRAAAYTYSLWSRLIRDDGRS